MLYDSLRKELSKLRAGLATINGATGATTKDVIERYRNDPSLLMQDAGLQPDPWQTEFLRSKELLNLILCSRQAGKTTCCAVLALTEAMTVANATVVVIAPIEPQASEFIRKAMTIYNRIGRPMVLKREAVNTIEFINNSRIIALPGKERSVHSYTASLLFIDEAARVPDAVYNAASPQLSVSKGRLVALSTAFAKSGWFHSEWESGEGYKRWSITAKECPRHSQRFLDGERRRMGDRWFSMAYMNTFYEDLAAVFHVDDVKASSQNDLQPYFIQGLGRTPGEAEVVPYFAKGA